MTTVYYLAKGIINYATSGQSHTLESEAVEKYRRNIQDINKKKEWKTTGRGAQFMGIASPAEEAEVVRAQVEALAYVDEETLIYAASLDQACGLYIKNPSQPTEAERFIFRKNDFRLLDFDYNPADKSIIASVHEGGMERHLALCHAEKSDCDVITEGESLDITPAFSRHNPQRVHFSSAGIYYDEARHTAHLSSYGISYLDLTSGEIIDLLQDEHYDFLRPKENSAGQLYCLRRPKQKPKGGRLSPKDILLVPVRLFKAIFSWLNFFSQRYTGESLTRKTTGANPAKNREKSAEEIYVEGNLINVEKTLKENSQADEKNPGIIPKSWELICRKPDGSIEIVKKGVLDYSFTADGGLLYSNGKYIVHRLANGEEERLCLAELATNLCYVP